MRYFSILLLSFVLTFSVSANKNIPENNVSTQPAFLAYYLDPWVDSLLHTMTVDEKIGQLFMVAGYTNEKMNMTEIVSEISKYKIGGICFFQGGPVKQAMLTNYYQQLSRIPLLIGIDGEWGLAMRLDSTVKYPKQGMLGAIDDNDELIYQMGSDIGRQCRRIGVQVDFAPVVDVNNNPKNPVINVRSFGENTNSVMHKGLAYMNGLQSEHVLAVAKHFPGHGDVDSDSHLTLPTVKQPLDRLKKVELVPFKYLIKYGLQSMLVAHLNVPALDTTHNMASSLSPLIVNKLLKTDMGFKGLIFTDAMNMKGVAAYYKPGDAALRAFEAGNDIILMPDNIQEAFQAIKTAVDSGKISKHQLDERCRRVLMMKRWAGLDHYLPVDIKNIANDINDPLYDFHKRRMAEKSVTLVLNRKDFLPLKRLDTLRIASVTIGTGNISAFHQSLSRYAPVKPFAINRTASAAAFDSLYNELKNYNLIIVGIINSDIRAAKNYGIGSTTVPFINKLSSSKKVVLDIFTSAYTLSWFEENHGLASMLMSYEDQDVIQDISAQMIFGGLPVSGKLPVSAADKFKEGTGITFDAPVRLAYTVPEEFGLSNSSFSRVDSLANAAIAMKATPGCQVLIAKNGKVLYYKSYGNFTYDNSRPVVNGDVYDLASVTKISATLPALMRLVDEKKINLNHKLKDYLPMVANSNKENLVLNDILTHQAGLEHFIPFYTDVLEQGKPGDSLAWLKPGIFSRKSTKDFPYKVADSLYMSAAYKDVIFQKILDSKVSKKKEYKYSDLGFMLMAEMIQNLTGKRLDKYVDSVFYRPLGMTTLGFNPLERIPVSRIAPTENDTVFRHQVIQGYVHDPAAAMLGGISGHAGLFSDANDVAKLMQMYLWKGTYGDERYFHERIFNQFNNTPFLNTTGNRRAIGFDKPDRNRALSQSPCACAPLSSFGHTGFTGTMVWADPDNQLMYIFLANRVYPDATTNKLANSNIRTQIHEEIYRIFGIPCIK